MGSYSKGRDVEMTEEHGSPQQIISDSEEALEMMVWEINTAKGFAASFQKLLGAYSLILSILATVNLIAFLQPPKGWNESRADASTSHLNAMSVMYNTGSIEAYAIASSLSLYSAISGLLFYLFCSQAGVTSLEDAEMPEETETDERGTETDNRGTETDELGTETDERGTETDERGTETDKKQRRKDKIEILHRTRAYLRCLLLPRIARNSTILSWFLAASLTFSLMAFISSGYAASSLHERLHYIVIPGIPGCILVLVCFVLAILKQGHDLDFDKQFDNFWLHVVPLEMKNHAEFVPDIRPLDDKARMALDRRISPFHKACKTSHISHKHSLQLHRHPHAPYRV